VRLLAPEVLFEGLFVNVTLAIALTALGGQEARLPSRFEAKQQGISGAPAVGAGMTVEFPPRFPDPAWLFIQPLGLSL
jgi:hypothetical protein